MVHRKTTDNKGTDAGEDPRPRLIQHRRTVRSDQGVDRVIEGKRPGQFTPIRKSNMADTADTADTLQDDDAAVVTDSTCGICLEDSKDPLNLPCGHSFCEGCLNGWRSRYGVDEEMRRKCPICRGRIPPSKEMVTTLLRWRAEKQRMEVNNETSSRNYRQACAFLEQAEEKVGKDWDGVTVLEDRNDNKQPVVMPDYVLVAIKRGDNKSVLRWISADRTEDRASAIAGAEMVGMSALMLANMDGNFTLMTLLLQLGANVDYRICQGYSSIGLMMSKALSGDVSGGVNLLLSWGASFFPDEGCSREDYIREARKAGKRKLANLLESELGGRRCEIVNLSSRPELNGKTCVADEFLPDSNQYKVTLEGKNKEVLVLDADNLRRRDRTPQDCGYYIEFKNGRTVRHDFDSSGDCQAFVAALNRGETQPDVTEEAKARADEAAAELLAELGLDDSPTSVPSSGDKSKKSKKKKGGKKKKK